MSEVHVFAGIAATNPSLFRRLLVPLGDPAAWLRIGNRTIGLVRDLEMDRVRSKSDCDDVVCPADFQPDGGLDGDRATATAQAVAELLRREGVRVVSADRTFPLIFASHLSQAGVEVQYDSDLGVLDRRQKSDQEIAWLLEAQSVTEEVMKLTCGLIATADVDGNGELMLEGAALTSERVRAFAANQFLERDYAMSHGAIVATAPEVADCHHSGCGGLRTGVPVIVDLFPMNNQTRYWGDCTRTVVHGEPTDTVKKMHAAVIAAKAASTAKLRLGESGDSVHKATEESLVASGYEVARGSITDHPSIQHGTGHGIGLEVHEPILLDHGGGALLEKEVFTIEPGLYGRVDGGVRVEDMLVVHDGEPQNLNRLHEGLDWR
ncbi:MAG: M24 family metallopeptidase [Planctomycetota bacterium]